MAGAAIRRDLGEVQALGGELLPPGDGFELSPAAGQGDFEGVADPVEGPAHLAATVGVEPTQLRLVRRQRRSLPQQLLVEPPELLEGRDGRDAWGRVGLDGGDVLQH